MSARLLLVLLCGALAACSSFDTKWRGAENGATRWDGRWTSEKHHALGGALESGRLRCVLTEKTVAACLFTVPRGLPPAAAHILHADFHANWLIFASNFTMTLAPEKNSLTDFRGTHDLPAIFGGTYRYTVHISGDLLTARYDSSYDRGTFDLTRVRP